MVIGLVRNLTRKMSKTGHQRKKKRIEKGIEGKVVVESERGTY